MGTMEATTALFMAAALVTAQAAPPAPTPALGSDMRPASVVVPSAQPVAQTPSPSSSSPSSPSSPSPAPAPTRGSPVVSTTPQNELDSPPSVRPFEMPTEPPPGPVPYAAAEAPVKNPVKVEEYNRTYEGPQDAEETYYEAGVKSAYEAEEALRGRLDGLWIVSAADGGAPLLSLVISDPGRPDAPPGGAWRDLSRAHDPDATGVIDQVVEEGPSVILQIRLKADAPPTTLRLTPSADGRWRGLMLDGGQTRPVVMDRKSI